MTELLAAIPRLFQRQREDAYSNLREEAQRDRTNERAVMRTVHQMDRAYEQTVKAKVPQYAD